MKCDYQIVWLLVILCCFSCKREEKKVSNEGRLRKLAALRDTAEVQKKNADLDSRLAFWNEQIKDPHYINDPVLQSKIHYYIAGVFYGKNKLDSIKSHMHIAWELMENQAGYDAEMVLLYSGLGNIAHKEQKLHQENYYLNRAAQILYADSTLDVLPKAKTSVYFAAAQTSARLKQFQTAFEYNRKALALLPKLPNDIDAKFRGYSQMALCFFNSNSNLDSLHTYIKKMETVYQLQPDLEKEIFIADRKVGYFIKKHQIDSVFFYNRKRLSLNLTDITKNGETANSITSGSLFSIYSDIISLFINQKQIDSSSYYLKKCEEFKKKYPNVIDDEQALSLHKNLVNYLFATKQYARAEREQELLLQNNIRIYEIESARSISEMSTVINLQAKDKSIINLNATVALSQERLQSNRLWLALSALATLLAGVLAALIYYIQKQKSFRNENEKTQLEQRLLRTQMEPHFIFNTLSALQSFVRFDEKEKTLKYLNQFGRLLRSSLELSRESLVPLSDEVETLENYLSLQQMRFDDAFDYEINLHDQQELDSIYIPPMLMQPFVENALLHGIDQNAKKVRICIDFIFHDNLLEVTIIDNGKGITTHPEMEKHTSLSTTISKQRLAILAKETGLPAGIIVKSKSGEGTKITITIPFMATKIR
jgi:sensor histidine kinase YesM